VTTRVPNGKAEVTLSVAVGWFPWRWKSAGRNTV